MIMCGAMAALSAFGGGCGKTENNESGKDPSGIIRVTDNRGLTPEEYTRLNVVGTDALGRKITEKSSETGTTRYVGIFYSLWLGQHKSGQTDIYDITKILQTEGGEMRLRDTSKNYDDTRTNEFHFFAEPLYGYYSMGDPWVLVRHMELLTLAGIDYLCCDMTNTVIYPEVVHKLANVLLEFQRQGFNPPKLMFYTNSSSGSTVNNVYQNFYKDHPEYDSVWFKPNGKPAIAGVTSKNNGASDAWEEGDFISAQMEEYFDVFESQWPTSKMTGAAENENALPWMSWYYPQHIHPGTKAMNVSIAQHSETQISYSAKAPESSRGYDHVNDWKESDFTAGVNFETEWKTVFDYLKKGEDVQNVLVTGWNEWMAIKTPYNGDVSYCDGWNDEYSRDAEMMNGSCGDNFYLQLMRNLRDYKYVKRLHYKYRTATTDIRDPSSLSFWNDVKAHYRDFKGDAIARDYENAVGKGRYTDNSNRNDITDVKVVHDDENLYLYVKTAENVTAYNGTDENWMNVLIGVGEEDGGFNGFGYLLNRKPGTDGKTSLEKSSGGYRWQSAGEAEYAVYGNVILYKVPLSALGLNKNNCYIRFKVCDNVTKPDDIMNYYISGDCAPIGRLAYSYGY